MEQMSLEEKLAKVKTPNLESQRETAIVLISIEDTLRAQNCELTSTAYFSALLALLGQAISVETSSISNASLASSTTYLLDLTTSHVPAPLLRSKFSQILQLLSPALTASNADAPLLRAAVGALESLLIAQDGSAWAQPQAAISPRSAIGGLLILALDSRPKVRRRALDAIAKILKHPPPSPSLDHPAADLCAETALQELRQTAETNAEATLANKKRGSAQEDAKIPALIHSLQLVRVVAEACAGWPSRSLDALVETLLAIARKSDEHVTRAAFAVFEAIFEGIASDSTGSSARLPRLREAIEEVRPSKQDSQLLPPWLAVLSHATDVSAQVEPDETFIRLPALFESVSELLDTHSHAVRISASECLISFAANCIPDNVLLEPSVYDEKTLDKLGRATVKLLSVKYQQAWVEVFNVLAALFETLRWQASPLLNEVIKTVGELRSSDSFTGRKEADMVLGKAIEAIGPSRVLELVPLNLGKGANPKQAGRAWLLPIMRDNVMNTELQHFKTELVPISEIFYKLSQPKEGQEKTEQTKVFEALVQQIWSILPGYCTLPTDVQKAFDQDFAERVSNFLYMMPDFRADICRALQNLVDSNKGVLEVESTEGGEEDLLVQRRVTKAMAQDNLDYLASISPDLLSVLFNVYSQTLPQYRGFILQCVNAYLSITPDDQLMDTFANVVSELEKALLDSNPQTQADKQKQKQGANAMPPASHTLMDLIITLAIYLPRSSYDTLFQITSKILPQSSDPQLQKKAYKLLPRLATCETGKQALQERSPELQKILLETAASASAPSRRDRIDAIATIIDHLPPSSDLHFIPAILSEVVISAKEVNEKARTAAFDTLVLMGEKMDTSGGVIVQSLIPGMPADAADAQANLEEFFTMVSAGLAGTTPHMISASIAALTRILFEFRNRLEISVVEDLVSTMDLFLQSANREIVRSVLGFVKVAAVSLPDAVVRPRLPSLIPGLVGWSHEHKARFRSKVKNILERLMRRFGTETIEQACPESDRKLIQNIRKTKQRSKRKREEAKSAGNDGLEEEHGATGRRRDQFESEFDAAVYGSGSSDDSDATSGDDSDAEMDGAAGANKRRRGRKEADSYIVEDADEPLDLLDTRKALASISSSKPLRFRKPADVRRTKAKTDLDGKLIIGDSDNEEGDTNGGATAFNGDGAPERGIDAYVDAIRGRDAARRGQRGKLKFSNRRGQPGRDDDGDEMEVDEADLKRAVRGNGRRSSYGGGGGRSPRSPGRGSFDGRGRGRPAFRGRVSKAAGGGGGGRGRPPRKKLY